MQHDATARLNEDTLFIACTRPSLWHGVPYEAVWLNVVVTVVLFLILFNPGWLLIGPALHYGMRHVASQDYNIFGTIALWAETKGRARNIAYWGGSSVSPLPIGPARNPRQVRISV